ncbi:MAG: hypothetical protein FJX77_10680, partial [Armatimonadetes bacterium]|nr:hypothetical protein [Armatimonadota bacterium]
MLQSPALPIYTATGNRPQGILDPADFDLLLDLAQDSGTRTWYVLYRDPVQVCVRTLDGRGRTCHWRLPPWFVPYSVLFRTPTSVRLLGSDAGESDGPIGGLLPYPVVPHTAIEATLMDTVPEMPGQVLLTRLGPASECLLDYDSGLDPRRIGRRRALARQTSGQ